MTLRFLLISTFLISFRPLDDAQSCTFQPPFEYFNDDTTSNLTSFIMSKARVAINEQKHSAGLSKTFNPSKLLPYNTSTTENPDILSRNLKSDNKGIKEKKREDAFEKGPATKSPHAVQLLIKFGQGKGSAICSGSLLTVDWVLTAAHCLTPPKGHVISDVIVCAGGYSIKEMRNWVWAWAIGSQVRHSKMTLPHPKYNHGNDYDIGLVMVDSFNVTKTVRPVEISTQPWNRRGYRTCQLTGFGIVQMGERRADDSVRKTHTLEVKQPCLCSHRLKMLFGNRVVARYICARPRQNYGVCFGDSGGGLVCDGKIRGVAMQIVQLLETATCEMQLLPQYIKCGSSNTLSVFQDSCPFLRWVNSHVRLFNDSQISGECVERGAAPRPLRGGAPYILLIVLVCLNTVNTTLFTS